MLNELFFALLLSLSLCADCFAVSLCSGVAADSLKRRQLLVAAAVFSTVHICFLLGGYFLGDLLVGYVERFARWIGFLLLLYVGGTMFVEAVWGKKSALNISGFRNILMSAVATSLDALAVGISLSMDRKSVPSVMITAAVLFIITFLTVATGLVGGRKIGMHFGKVAEIVGALILVGLGVGILI